jgi:Holliday junction resolvasome RuvABC endonuclease subunit
MTPRVVGADLSLSSTGIAGVDGQTRTIHTNPTKNLTEQHTRLTHIVTEISLAVPTWPLSEQVDLVVIEGPSFSSSGAGTWDRAGLWWLVVSALLADGVPVAVVPPSVLKKYATGKGTATKPDMRMALFQRAGIDERDDNRVDAWWLRTLGLDHLGHPVVEMPQLNRAVLTKVDWPAPAEPAALFDQPEGAAR